MITDKSPETNGNRRFTNNLTVNLPGLKRKGSMRPNRSIVRGKSLRPLNVHPVLNTDENAKEENSQKES